MPFHRFSPKNMANLPTTLIAPSILAADFLHLEDEIKRVEDAGVEWIHLDVMDGHFVPNISFGPMVVKFVASISDLYMDAHLMIENPGKYLEDFKKAGAHGITLHAEVSGVIPDDLNKIRDMGLDVGISINPETPVDVLDPVYDIVDLILVMSVHPGFGGQKFIRDAIPKVEHITGKIKESGRNIMLQIDGGIGPVNAAEVRRAGARNLVAGSSIFRAEDPKEAVRDMRKEADAAAEK